MALAAATPLRFAGAAIKCGRQCIVFPHKAEHCQMVASYIGDPRQICVRLPANLFMQGSSRLEHTEVLCSPARPPCVLQVLVASPEAAASPQYKKAAPAPVPLAPLAATAAAPKPAAPSKPGAPSAATEP